MQRRIWIVALVVILSTAALLLLASQTWADFTHTKDVLLSYNNETCSAVKPRLATSPNGHQLAVAWVQETQQGDTCRAGGFGVLRWATEESSYTGWATPLKVFLSGQGTACVNHIDVAVDADNVAHVIATIQDPCDLDATTDTSLHYRACTLDGGNATCGPDTTIISEDPQGNGGYYFLEASVAVNDQGMPFVVYGRRQVEGALNSEVRATALNSNGTWRTPFLLSSGEKAHRPALAWGRASNNQGYVHVVWETHETPSDEETFTNGRVKYIRCPDSADEKSDCGSTERSFSPAAGVYPRPAIAVSGPHDRVIIAWNRGDDIEPNPPCEEFGLFYYRSDNNGTTFLETHTREIISDLPPASFASNTYRSTEDEQGTAETEEYISYLRPAVAMNEQGLPLVAWQAVDTDSGIPSPEYVITTTQAITWYGAGGIAWQEENRWGIGDAIERRINPDIAPASPDYEPTGGIHMVYMKQDVLTDIGERYRIYYSYTGDTLYVEPTPSPTVDEAATSTPTPNPNQNLYQAPNTIYLPMVLRSRI